MELSNIKFMKRKNLGNYEHEELTLEAIVGPNDDAAASIAFIMREVNIALGLIEEKFEPVVETKETKTKVKEVALKPLANEPVATAKFVQESEVVGDVPPVIPEEAKVVKKAAPKPKEKVAEVTPSTTSSVAKPANRPDESPVQLPKAASKAPVDKNVVVYDATVKEHRSRFATYLGSNFPNWKTAKPADQIKEFSLGLTGKPFEDVKGNMLESFKSEIQTFFGQ